VNEDTIKTNDKPWLFKKGNPGGPGRPVGKSLKEYTREMLASMTEEERLSFLEGLPKTDLWKMAEGNPANATDITTGGDKIVFLPPEVIANLTKDDIAPKTEGSNQLPEEI